MATSVWLAPLPSPCIAQAAPKQLTPEDAAIVKLNAGRRAFNEKNYPLATAAFKEFITGYGAHREAPSAWYGLGLCLLQTAPTDYPAAADAFQHASSVLEFPDRPSALYYWGTAHRGLGNKSMADVIARPNEMEALTKAAALRYEEAGRHFVEAQDAFSHRVTDEPAVGAALPADTEWSARARCDAAEMLLKIGKTKEALDLSSPFQSDPILSRSRYRQLGLYYLGYTQFGIRDYLAAGRSLSQLAPFQQDYGVHARYLLARIHHLSDERPEAAAQYKLVLDEFDKQKKAAELALQNPAVLDADRKAQLESVARGPIPDYAIRARFYGAVLQYEDSHYPEVAETFTLILQQQPKHALANEARLRLGYCQLQSAKPTDAIATLDPLKDDKQLSDRALWWTARAKIALADANNVDAYLQVVRGAIDTMTLAADRSRQIFDTDPDAKARRADILMELADTRQLGKQYKEAANTYQQILTEDPKTDRAEEARQRTVTALHLAGQFADSDNAADEFQKLYPKSTLLPAVLFRQAENAYRVALTAADDKTPHPPAELEPLFKNAITRYQKLVNKYSDFEYVDLAKQGLATCHYRLGHYPEAIALLTTIPESNRTGELATIPYLQADCEIRTLPAEADDALTAERLIDTADDASKLLETFVAAQPKSPQAPDALLKLGYCYQRMSSQMAKADERLKTLAKAKDAYDRSVQQFPTDSSQPAVLFERARCLSLMGDTANALNELRRFQNDPLRSTPNAPLAMIRLSTLLRSQNVFPEAADVMKRSRDFYEPILTADPARVGWIPMLRYENGLALQDLHKLPEALAIFDDLVKQFPGKPEAVNASWRIAQCRRQDAADKIAEARAVAARPAVTPTEVSTAYSHTEEPLRQLAAAVELLRAQTDIQAAKAATSEATLRMVYELAWCNRVLSEAETDAAVVKLQQAAIETVRANWPKDSSPPAALSATDITLADVPIQPSEQKARDLYQRLIFAGPTTPLASQARFEMAELLSRRGDVDAALDLLATALENQPPKELSQRIKVRVAAALLAKKNAPSALAQIQPILADKDSLVVTEAKFLSGEAHIQQQEWPKAIEDLVPFRDVDPFRTVPGIADHALARLGFALGQSNQWEPSRVAYEALLSRFPQSPWIDDARFQMGWALQNQKRFDEAVNVYTDLTHRSVSESAARAMLNIGVCRLEQKRPAEALPVLLAVPLTYGYPDTTAAACYQAARAHMDSQKPQEAAKLLNRVVKDYPTTSWASLAQQRLAEIK